MADVSIFDEIQDLQPTIVEYFYSCRSVDVLMGMGDDDETLDYEKFDWRSPILLNIVKHWKESPKS